MLNKNDLAERAPSAGDILHNTLQFLLRDAPQQMLPQSPLTPHHPLMSPSPLTPAPSQQWSMIKPELHNLGHFLQQGTSVTLSPAPSEQSGGSPRHPDNASSTSSGGPGFNHSSSSSTGSGHSGHSDSEDSTRDDSSSPQRSPLPPNSLNSAFTLASLKQISEYQRAAVAAAAAAANNYQQEDMQYQQHAQQQQQQNHQQQKQSSPAQQTAPPTSQAQAQQSQPQQQSTPPLPSQTQGPDEPLETGTNGRLLWDFLQQLLNDPAQRYARYIAWKNRETGVFKIVDPPGLARLWGIQKNHLSMNYDKMSRALRYYYRVNILRKVQGERHCYQFLRNPSELKGIKNISMLRGAPLPATAQQRIKEDTTPQVAPMEEEGPTDLSMPAHHQRYTPAHHNTNGHQSPVQYNSTIHHQTPSTIQVSSASMETETPQNLTLERQHIVKTEDFYD